MTDTKPKLTLHDGDTVQGDGTVQTEAPDSNRRFIHLEVIDGQLQMQAQIDTPTEGLKMLMPIFGMFTQQADQAHRENMAYVGLVEQFREWAKDNNAPEPPINPTLQPPPTGKVIGSPLPPGRQKSIALATQGDLARLDNATKEMKRL